MSIPKVFISYSHDSQEHKKWVLDLATRLRNTGIDAIIDQWELRPGDDLPHFMETHLADSDYVLMVCTNRYVEKANSGVGGVGYEKMIVTSNLLTNIDSNKIIPIIRQDGSRNIPTFLKTKLFIDFSLTDEFEYSYDELIRTIHDSPLYEKPEIGNNPFTPVEDIRPEKVGDALREMMKIVIEDFERGKDWTIYKELVQQISISRIMLDTLILEAQEKGLVRVDDDGDLFLEKKGKFYAIENKLVKA